jgi:diamine N-acetyltransferase
MRAGDATTRPTTSTLTVRRATAGDAARLAAFGARAFHDTFAADNRPEDMAAYLAASFSAERQGAELTDPETIVLLAEREGVVAGYAQLRFGAAPAGPVEASLDAPVELTRFYVGAEWIGRGVAGPLMRHALDAARRGGGRTLWLGVWERNARAIAFYRKWGFADAGSQKFALGDDVQTDRVMVRLVAAS